MLPYLAVYKAHPVFSVLVNHVYFSGKRLSDHGNTKETISLEETNSHEILRFGLLFGGLPSFFPIVGMSVLERGVQCATRKK